MGLFTETIADAAAQIAELVLRGIEPHPVLKMAIEEAEKSVVRVTVPKKSNLIGQTIKKANIPPLRKLVVMLFGVVDQCFQSSLSKLRY